MMIRTLLVLALIAAAMPLLAQSTEDGDRLVSVPKKYVSSEGLNHQDHGGAEKWLDIGREIGIATREGLDAVVDDANKFGSTKVGTFVMVMIAWKIVGHDILGVLLGIPLLIGGVCLWLWIMRRLFFGYRVLDRKEGHTKIYKDQPPYDFDSSDGRAFAGVVAVAALAAWCGSLAFLVIFHV